jgi:hypothetical protein
MIDSNTILTIWIPIGTFALLAIGTFHPIIKDAVEAIRNNKEKIKPTKTTRSKMFTRFNFAVLCWLGNLIILFKEEEITRGFIYGCVVNVALLQILILGYIVKRWFNYISEAVEKK